MSTSVTTSVRRQGAPTRSVVTGLVAGGLLVAVPPLVEYVAGDFFLLLPVALAMMLVALPGLRRHQAGADEPLGPVGLRMMNIGLLGCIVTVVVGSLALDALSAGIQDVAEPVLVIVAGAAALAAIIGLGLLTAGMVQAKVYPLSAVLLFGAGLLLALVAEVAEQTITGTVPTWLDILPPTLFAASGLGLIGIVVAARADPPS